MNDFTDAEAALAAMKRAAENARVRASRFGSKLAYWKDGKVVLVDPGKNGAEQKVAEPLAAVRESEADEGSDQ